MDRQQGVRRGAQPVLACGDDRVVVAANRAACLLLRLPERDVVGLRLDDLVVDEDHAALHALFAGTGTGSGSGAGTGAGADGPTPLALATPDGARLVVDARFDAGVGEAPHALTLAFPPAGGIRRAAALLSAREAEVLTQVALGRTGQAIAAELFLAPATVESHVSRALGKLGAANRPHGVALALRAGEIDPNAFLAPRGAAGTGPPPSRGVPAVLAQMAIDALDDPVAVLDGHGRVLALNAAWRAVAAVVEHDPDGDGLAAAYATAVGGGEGATDLAWAVREIALGASDSFLVEYALDGPDGPRWLEARAARHRGDGPLRVVVRLHDITGRRAEREASIVGRSLLDELDVAVVRTSVDGAVVTWSAGAEELFGRSTEDAIGRPIDELVRAADPGTSVREGLQRVLTLGRWSGRVRIRRDDGSEVDLHVRHAAIRDGQAPPSGVLSVAADAAAEVRAERDLHSARERLRAVAEAMSEGLLVLDADGRVEDMNPAAERLLGWAVEDLRSTGALGTGELVRRDGTVLPVAARRVPFDGRDWASGSVVVFPAPAEGVHARRTTGPARAAQRTLGALHAALDEGRLRVHAQPVVVLDTGRVLRHALVPRIVDGEGGLVGPGLFLPVAREHGLLRRIDRWMLEQAVRLAADGHPVELDVPVEAATDPTHPDVVATTLRDGHADPTLLTLAVPPAAMRTDAEQTATFVRRMAGLGAAVALDDFGSGDGAVPLLRDLPWTDVELDVGIVADLRRRASSRGVVRAFVELAHGFRVRTVARGVDDAATVAVLVQLGVELGRGDALHAPVPADEALPVPKFGANS